MNWEEKANLGPGLTPSPPVFRCPHSSPEAGKTMGPNWGYVVPEAQLISSLRKEFLKSQSSWRQASPGLPTLRYLKVESNSAVWQSDLGFVVIWKWLRFHNANFVSRNTKKFQKAFKIVPVLLLTHVHSCQQECKIREGSAAQRQSCLPSTREALGCILSTA